MGNFLEGLRAKAFGSTDTPPAVFGEQGAQDLGDFFRQGFRTPASEDPRLNTFLDKSVREINRSLAGAQQNFERSLGPNDRLSGDAIAFQRDLAIAGSEQKSAAMTDILGLFESLRLENATGALQLLIAESEERLGRARFTMDERLGNINAEIGVAQTVSSFFPGGGGGGKTPR